MFVLKYVSKSFSCLHLKSVQLFDSCEEGNGIKLVKMEIYYFVWERLVFANFSSNLAREKEEILLPVHLRFQASLCVYQNLLN